MNFGKILSDILIHGHHEMGRGGVFSLQLLFN